MNKKLGRKAVFAAIAASAIVLSACESVKTVNTQEQVESLSGSFIKYEKYQLENGLTVILHEDQSDPLVEVNVTYQVGSAREDLGR
jgi:zinc protease